MVITHNSPVNFKIINFLLGIKMPYKSPNFQVLWWTFAKFLMLFSKPQESFSPNFASLSSVIKDNSSVIFCIKHYTLFMEGTSQSVNVWDFWVLGSKFTNFLSFLKQQISFSSILHQSLASWDTTPLYFFSCNFIYF